MLLRDSEDFFRHLREIRIFQHEAAQRIATLGIETGGDDDEVRMKLAFDLTKRVRKCLAVISCGGCRPERYIQSKAFTLAASALVCGTGAGIVGILVR